MLPTLMTLLWDPRQRHADVRKYLIRPRWLTLRTGRQEPGQVAEFTAKVQAMTGLAGYTTRQAAYDIRKLRAKHLADKPGRSRRYRIPPEAARTIAALLTLRDQVIAPILAGMHSPRMGRKPKVWTAVDRDYEQIRIDMQALFGHLGLSTVAAAA